MGLPLVSAYAMIGSFRISFIVHQLANYLFWILRPCFSSDRRTLRHLGAVVVDVRNILYQTQYITHLHVYIWRTDS